jgi:hypothetical protein
MMGRHALPSAKPTHERLSCFAKALGLFSMVSNKVKSDASAMCNLYSITTNQAAIAALFRRLNRYVGNLPPMPGVFPDYPAPVVRNAGEPKKWS